MLKVKVWDCDKSCDNGWAHHLLLLVGVSLPDDFLVPPNSQTYQDAIWNNLTEIWRNIEIHSVIHISMIITEYYDPRSEKSYEMK